MTPASWFCLYSGLAFGTAAGLMLSAIFSRSQQAEGNQEHMTRTLWHAPLTPDCSRAENHLERFICGRWGIANLIGMPVAWHRAAERLRGASLYCLEVGYKDHANILHYAADLATFRAEIECTASEPE